MSGDELYNGHDLLTGLHDSFYFSTEFDRKKAQLKRSGESNLLLCLCLPEDTQEERVKQVADYWEKTFVRTCRYEKKTYTFLALDKSKDSHEKEREILNSLTSKFPNITIRINSIIIDGNSDSLDDSVKRILE
ncbi:hypothetical protein KY342_06650 [Candidatus Woesearchaeota archaeon]|nr:hypothetical protein [Candidatus Woesearchaeota archaeon]